MKMLIICGAKLKVINAGKINKTGKHANDKGIWNLRGRNAKQRKQART